MFWSHAPEGINSNLGLFVEEFANAASNDGDRQSDDSYDEDEFSIRASFKRFFSPDFKIIVFSQTFNQYTSEWF